MDKMLPLQETVALIWLIPDKRIERMFPKAQAEGL